MQGLTRPIVIARAIARVIPPSGNPDPTLSSLGVTQADAKAVFPANAGIHPWEYWTPAFAGATG
jgi:hypothetical protein